MLVKEVFYTIQGEGANAGMPAIFVRMGHCNLRCAFCDTEFNNDLMEKDSRDLADTIRATFVSCSGYARRLQIVFTGGEPTLWDLSETMDILDAWSVENKLGPPFYMVETNGLLWQPWLKRCHVTISPKTPVDKLNGASRNEAEVFKFLVGEGYPRLFEGEAVEKLQARRFIQPVMDEDYYQNLQSAIAWVLEHPWWTLSLQTHKLINVR